MGRQIKIDECRFINSNACFTSVKNKQTKFEKFFVGDKFLISQKVCPILLIDARFRLNNFRLRDNLLFQKENIVGEVCWRNWLSLSA